MQNCRKLGFIQAVFAKDVSEHKISTNANMHTGGNHGYQLPAHSKLCIESAFDVCAYKTRETVPVNVPGES